MVPNLESKTSVAGLMARVREFKSKKLPEDDRSHFVNNVNALIDKYNKNTTESTKKQFLQQIQKTVQEFEHKYPPSSLFVNSPEYQKVHDALFDDIRAQYASIGINSVRDAQQSPSSLPEIIANMSSKSAATLADLLNYKHRGAIDLKDIYEDNDKSQEAENFRAFTDSHSIRFIGGENSKNYEVVSSDPRIKETLVLKLENRLDRTRAAESHLVGYEFLKDRFPRLETERQVIFKTHLGDDISRALVVTEMFSRGNLFNQEIRSKDANKLREKSGDPSEAKTADTADTKGTDKLAANIGNYFVQMAQVFIHIQDSGCIFPDAKDSNWLVDDNENLRLADTKSFLFTDKNGLYSKDGPENKYGGIVYTPEYSPPELRQRPLASVSADSVHAYTLGHNLYKYATGKHPSGSNPAKFNFDVDIFKGSSGLLLQTLVQQLTQPNASDRLSVKDARDALHTLVAINKNDVDAESRKVIAVLNGLKFGSNDQQMSAYIQKNEQQLKDAKPNEKGKILAEMQVMALHFKGDKAAMEIRHVVENYRNNAHWYTSGMKDKADRIEQAMSKVPLEDRTKFGQSQRQEVKDVLDAFAAARGSNKDAVKGAADSPSSSSKFNAFKQKYQEQKETHQTEHKHSKQEETPDHSGPKFTR